MGLLITDTIYLRDCEFIDLYWYSCVSELESLDQTTLNEWKGWVKGRDDKVQWEVIDESSYDKTAMSLKSSTRSQGNWKDLQLILILFGGNYVNTVVWRDGISIRAL